MQPQSPRLTLLLVAIILVIVVSWRADTHRSNEQRRDWGVSEKFGAANGKSAWAPSTLIGSAPERTDRESKSGPGELLESGVSAREKLQRSPQLRSSTMLYARSNELSYAVASLNARIYCSWIGGKSEESAAEFANRRYYLAPPMRTMLRVSDVSKRVETVELARQRCKLPDDAPTDYDQAALDASRAVISSYLAITKELGSLPRLDLRELPDATRSTLFASDPSVLLSALVQVSSFLSQTLAPEITENETILASALAIDLAACRLGDLCTPDSFRMAESCLQWGACDGNNLSEAIGRLLEPRPDLDALVRQYTETVLAAVREGRPQ